MNKKVVLVFCVFLVILSFQVYGQGYASNCKLITDLVGRICTAFKGTFTPTPCGGSCEGSPGCTDSDSGANFFVKGGAKTASFGAYDCCKTEYSKNVGDVKQEIGPGGGQCVPSGPYLYEAVCDKAKGYPSFVVTKCDCRDGACVKSSCGNGICDQGEADEQPPCGAPCPDASICIKPECKKGSCPKDCQKPVCGNGICEGAEHESCPAVLCTEEAYRTGNCPPHCDYCPKDCDKCTDSDNSQNYNIKPIPGNPDPKQNPDLFFKGTAKGIFGGETGSTTDFCTTAGNCGGDLSPCEQKESDVVAEVYCDGKYLRNQKITCPFGCKDGACIREKNECERHTFNDCPKNCFQKCIGPGTGGKVGAAVCENLPGSCASYGLEDIKKVAATDIDKAATICGSSSFADLCYSAIARTSKHSTLCEQVKTTLLKDNCYSGIAIDGDYRACSKITSEALRKSCEALAHCNNLVKDRDETDVDCGGTMCKKCTNGVFCKMNNDCTSKFCDATTYTCSVAPGCSQLQESACGSASGCYWDTLQKVCITGSLCKARFKIRTEPGDIYICEAEQAGYEYDSQANKCVLRQGTGCSAVVPFSDLGKCEQTCIRKPSQCVNGVKDGSETDVDCGGANCAPCPCYRNSVKDGRETDVDCGGSCTPCDAGKKCDGNADCKDGNCDQTTKTCKAASCFNDIKDASETDVNCGNIPCPKCGNEKTCNENTNCASNFCDATTHKCGVAPCKSDANCGAGLYCDVMSKKCDSEASCKAKGGSMQTRFSGKFCNFPAKDAGKVCTSGEQCDGDCMAVTETQGKCSSFRVVFGCVSWMNKGKMERICID